MSHVSPQQRVLNALQSGLQTWESLKAATKLNDERLGFTLGELLDLRQIWTVEKQGVRVYGIERRTGLVARVSHPQRRSTD